MVLDRDARLIYAAVFLAPTSVGIVGVVLAVHLAGLSAKPRRNSVGELSAPLALVSITH